MNVYTTDKIRNVVLLGHGGCGKTSLAEAMAYLAGMTTRMGKVTDGNTISDYDKEEIKRHFSINTSVIPIVWGDTKINILDTPGYFDFHCGHKSNDPVCLYRVCSRETDQSAGVVSYHRWSIVFTMGTAGKKTEKKDRAVHTGCGRTNGRHQGKNK